jgi:hypothetical protein
MISVRAQLDETSCKAEWAGGRALHLEQLIEEAIAFVKSV